MASTNSPIGSRSRYVCSSLKVLLKDSAMMVVTMVAMMLVMMLVMMKLQ